MDSADQNSAGEAVSVSNDVEAVILAVNAIDIGKPRRTKDDRIAFGLSLVLMHGGVTGFVCLGFHDLAAGDGPTDLPNECAA